MCLFVSSFIPKRIKFVDSKVTLYKVLQPSYTYKKGLEHQILISPYRGFNYKPGWNKPISYHKSYDRVIRGGAIHVFTDFSYVDYFLSNSYSRVLKVICYEKDFIAEGQDGDAAFKKIWISKDMYESALKYKYKIVRVLKTA